ncbi:MAG: hypothetical protein OXG78_15025, partial [Chloroflexi bacterium]|nr:hypothetical protein [Chloroflexota bacterium]
VGAILSLALTPLLNQIADQGARELDLGEIKIDIRVDHAQAGSAEQLQRNQAKRTEMIPQDKQR